MKRFKNILVVTGEHTDPINNPAIARGAALAAQNQGRLTLMDVIPEPKDMMREYKGIIRPEELLSIQVKQREKELMQSAEELGSAIDVRVHVSTGQDFIEIIRQMLLAEHDLLMKMANAHDEGFHSSDFHLMRKCPKPVWLLKPRRIESQSPKILAALDLTLEDRDEGRNLNTFIMELATSVASWENSQLHTLSCWSLYGESALRDSGFMRVSDAQLTALLNEEQEHYHQRLSALANRCPYASLHTHLIKGDPVECIPAFVRKHAIDVVVMGTVARSGIPGLLIGNTAETILQLIDASVITLKPEGFESPVH
ncbi:MAG TPA: hypothetical protein DD979_17570 [Gammaproteobacteria bacterium]|jgi:nucleotide-binding universal stress UspA family protein|nr:hypothetical protein [Gammaproteobacteria bacterium]